MVLGKPYPWCRVLAEANDDVLACAFAGVARRFAASGVTGVLHRRERDTFSGDQDRWFLFVVVVFSDARVAADTRVIEHTHASLCSAIQETADAYTHSWATIKRYRHSWATIKRSALDDARLAAYHRGKPLAVLPPPPPRRESLSLGGQSTQPKPAPVAEPKPAPTTQRSLF